MTKGELIKILDGLGDEDYDCRGRKWEVKE